MIPCVCHTSPEESSPHTQRNSRDHGRGRDPNAVNTADLHLPGWEFIVHIRFMLLVLHVYTILSGPIFLLCMRCAQSSLQSKQNKWRPVQTPGHPKKVVAKSGTKQDTGTEKVKLNVVHESRSLLIGLEIRTSNLRRTVV